MEGLLVDDHLNHFLFLSLAYFSFYKRVNQLFHHTYHDLYYTLPLHTQNLHNFLVSMNYYLAQYNKTNFHLELQHPLHLFSQHFLNCVCHISSQTHATCSSHLGPRVSGQSITFPDIASPLSDVKRPSAHPVPRGSVSSRIALTLSSDRIFHRDFFLALTLSNLLHNEPYGTIVEPPTTHLSQMVSATPLTAVSQCPASYCHFDIMKPLVEKRHFRQRSPKSRGSSTKTLQKSGARGVRGSKLESMGIRYVFAYIFMDS